VALHAPLLAQAAPHIAHRAIRNRGTFGGSLAYADPSAEWPACVLALDGTLVLQGAKGERRVAAADFFQGLYSTARQADELLVAVELPLLRPASGSTSARSRVAMVTTRWWAWPHGRSGRAGGCSRCAWPS
jgi:carbon-monoxide dehydrogenase medium subunit